MSKEHILTSTSISQYLPVDVSYIHSFITFFVALMKPGTTNMEVKIGDKFTLDCETLYNQDMLVLIFHKKMENGTVTNILTQRPSQGKDYYGTTLNRNKVNIIKWGIITIKNSTLADEGQYYCTAQYMSGPDKNKDLMVLRGRLRWLKG